MSINGDRNCQFLLQAHSCQSRDSRLESQPLMGELVEFKKNKIFSLGEAQRILPVIRRITQDAVENVTQIEHQIHNLSTETVERRHLEQDLNGVIHRWSGKVTKLGAVPKGFWLVDFDNGDGYFCWKYGEAEVKFFHEYSTDFTGRAPIN